MTAATVTAAELRRFIERVEALHEQRADISAEISAVYAEAKARGYDTKAMKDVIRIRRANPQEQAEHEAVVQIYRDALGDLASTPLGDWAERKAASS